MVCRKYDWFSCAIAPRLHAPASSKEQKIRLIVLIRYRWFTFTISQSSRRRICPLPVPLPRSGGGPSGQIAAYSGLRLGSVTFCASLLGQSAALAALRCPKKSSRCSLARFFRPLRMLRLAASATGGARLRIPIRRDPLSLQNRATNPSFSSPIKPTIYAILTQQSPIL